jgi:hypothetical protein
VIWSPDIQRRLIPGRWAREAVQRRGRRDEVTSRADGLPGASARGWRLGDGARYSFATLESGDGAREISGISKTERQDLVARFGGARA